MNAKETARSEAKERLQHLDHEFMAAASRKIRAFLQPQLSPGKRVLFFAALRRETDLLPLLEEHPETIFALPRIEGQALHIHRAQAGCLSPKGKLGIREPLATAEKLDPATLDIILIPGLAFSPLSGTRLGRGAGYYDRFLAPLPPSLKRIGIAFSAQLFDELPCEAHDIPMHGILTELGWATANPFDG